MQHLCLRQSESPPLIVIDNSIYHPVNLEGSSTAHTLRQEKPLSRKDNGQFAQKTSITESVGKNKHENRLRAIEFYCRN